MPKARSPPSWPLECHSMMTSSKPGRSDAAAGGPPCSAHLRRLAVHFERAAQADVDIAVLLVVGMERQADREALDLQEHLGIGTPAGHR